MRQLKLPWVQEGNAYEAVEVTLGESSGGLVEIKEGLKSGDRAVTQGGILLYAQSLKAAGEAPPSEEEAGHSEGEESHAEGEEAVAANSPSEQSFLPGWLLSLLGGSAIAAGAFWIGRSSKTSKRSTAAIGRSSKTSKRSTAANYGYEKNLSNGNSHQSQPSPSNDLKGRKDSEIEHR